MAKKRQHRMFVAQHRRPRIRRGAVTRPRLQDLAARIGQYPVTLIVAPAGYGKTTLVSQWLAELDAPVAWLTCQAQEADRISFWSMIFSALETVQPGCAQAASEVLLALPPAPLGQLGAAVATMLATLPAGCLLVLDDLHELPPSLVEEHLPLLLDALPNHMHLIIMTRQAPQIALARRRARGEVWELPGASLQFARDEVAAFLRQTLDLTVDDQLIDQIAVQVEGWAAGLQLMGLLVLHQGMVSAMPQVAAQQTFFTYFAEEVLQAQPPEVQQFLCDIAILPAFNRAVCEAVTGQPTSQDLLQRCQRANLFLFALDDAEQWYRFHPLFAAFLCSRLPAARIHALHQRAYAWYRQQGMFDDALQQALLGQDEPGAIQIITQQADDMLINGKSRVLLNWTRALPTRVEQQALSLLRVRAWAAAIQGEWEDAEYCLTHMAAKMPMPAPAEAGEMHAIRAFIAANKMQWVSATELAQQALATLPTDHTLHGFTLLGLGLAAQMMGDVATAHEALMGAITAARQTHNLPILLTGIGTLASITTAQGALMAAYALCQEAQRADQVAQQMQQHSPLIGMIDLALGNILLEWNELEPARLAVERCLSAGQRAGNVAAQTYAAVAMERVWLAQGQATDHPLVAAAFADAGALVPPFILTTACAWRLRRAIIRQEISQAGQWQRRLLPGLQPAPIVQSYEYLSLARFHLLQGDGAAALALLETMLPQASVPEKGATLLEIKLLQALALRQQRLLPVAVACLEGALDLAESGGYLRLFIDEGPPMAELLQLVPHHAYARQILRLSAPSAANSPIAERAILTDRERAVLQFVAQGMTNQEIAQQLVVAPGTIKTHLNNLFAKLGVRSRAQAIAFAQTLHLL